MRWKRAARQQHDYSNTIELAEAATAQTWLASREIWLIGEVNDNLFSTVGAGLLHLAQDDPQQPIKLYVSSDGGDYHTGIALADLIRGLPVPVHTVGLSTVYSAATYPFLAGTHRSCYPHTSFYFHSISVKGEITMGQAAQVFTHWREALQSQARLLADTTLVTEEEWLGWFLSDNEKYLSSTEALKLGVVDQILPVRGMKRPITI